MGGEGADTRIDEHAGPSCEPRVLFDTNVWRYLVEQDAIERLRSGLKAANVRVAVAPAVVYEILRTSDPQLRGNLIKAVTRGSWERLMPEAYTQAMDVVDLIRVRRPEWLRTEPDVKQFYRLKADWTGKRGFWRRVRNNSGTEAAILGRLEGDVFEVAHRGAIERRADLSNLHFDRVRVDGGTGVLTNGGMPGWDGEPFDLWRILACDVWWAGIGGRSQKAYIDWLDPLLDLRQIKASCESWNRLWLYEAEMNEAPREWIRWAAMFLQGLRKVTTGTPGDNQITAYLLDTEVLVTADSGFAAIVNKVHSEAPFVTARAALVPAAAGDLVPVILGSI